MNAKDFRDSIELFKDPNEALNCVETVFQEYYEAFIKRMSTGYLFRLLEKEDSTIWSNSIDYCTPFAKLILTHKFRKEEYSNCLENVHELIERKQHLEGLDPKIYFGEELIKYDKLIKYIFESVTDKLK